VVWLVVGLAVLAFLQAIVLYPWLTRVSRAPDGGPLTEVNLPQREVRVLESDGDPALILKTPLDLPGADRLGFQALDEHLFPGGGRHRYYLLHVLNDSREERSFDPASPVLVLEDDSGRTHAPVDLAGALESRIGALPAYLVPQLRIWIPRGGPVALPPGSRRTFLFAFAADAEFARIARARLGDEVLEPRTYRKDALDGELDNPDALLRAKRQ
jgi:hypothetical protein